MTEEEFCNNYIEIQGYLMWCRFPYREDIKESGEFDCGLQSPHPCLILLTIKKDENIESVKLQSLITVFGTSKKVYSDCENGVFSLVDKLKIKELGLTSETKWAIKPSNTAIFPLNRKFFNYKKNFVPIYLPNSLIKEIELYVNNIFIKRMIYDLIYKVKYYFIPPKDWHIMRYKK